jgi:flagellar biosynthesis chaperone FliJ
MIMMAEDPRAVLERKKAEKAAGKKIVLKPTAALPKAAPLAAPLAGPVIRDDEETTERPLVAPATPPEVTVEADLGPLAASTRDAQTDGKGILVSPPAPAVAPLSVPPAQKPAGSGLEKIVKGVKDEILPELQRLLQPIKAQLDELKSQLDGLSGKVNTHEEDMTQLNEELEGKMSADALASAEKSLQSLVERVDGVEKALEGKASVESVDGVEKALGSKASNEDLEGKASAEEFGQLKAAAQVAWGDDFETVHGNRQDYQESTTRQLIDYLLDLNEGNVNEFVDVLNRRGPDISKALLGTFLQVPDIVRAELARRKGFKLSELEDPDTCDTQERAMGAAGVKIEVDEDTEKVVNNAKSIHASISEPVTEGES